MTTKEQIYTNRYSKVTDIRNILLEAVKNMSVR